MINSLVARNSDQVVKGSYRQFNIKEVAVSIRMKIITLTINEYLFHVKQKSSVITELLNNQSYSNYE